MPDTVADLFVVVFDGEGSINPFTDPPGKISGL